MATLVMERDAGFCSGGDEDEGFYSHTDASDDSADIKVQGDRSVSLLRNKRKCSEPRRLDTELPAKKRKLEMFESKTSPFRPWSPAPIRRWPEDKLPIAPLVLTPSRLLVQKEPLSLVSKKKEIPRHRVEKCESRTTSETAFKMDSILALVKQERIQQPEPVKAKPSQQSQQRNYKNMTRERRIEANARERTRVHTISAAFDTLRHSIPAFSHNQKLSKLSVLRIACSYIMTLSRLSGQDYSEDQSEPALADCVSNVSKTIQTEGKIRKKKDD